MEKQYDVVALGELLIDFTEYGVSGQNNPVLEANPGGAPCNVLAMLAKLGHKTAFIGKVGKDRFGSQLAEAIAIAGIDGSGLILDPGEHTTLAFVRNFENGEREFSFYRDPGADEMLQEDEVLARKNLIEKSRIFHLGTLSTTHPEARQATWKALEIAEQSGCLISFDPNLRENLWKDLKEAKTQTLMLLKRCHILKISDNEILWLLEKSISPQDLSVSDYKELVVRLAAVYPNIQLLTLSLGARGSIGLARSAKGENLQEADCVYVPAFLQTQTVDTTGAGDTFGACILHGVLSGELLPGGWAASDVSERFEQSADLESLLQFANAAASLLTMKKGALLSMPEEKEIRELLRRDKDES